MKNFLSALIKTLISTILMLGIILGLCYAGSLLEYKYDNKIYNNGKCYSCEKGNYELFNIQISKGRTYYIYRCDNCGAVLTTQYDMEIKMKER